MKKTGDSKKNRNRSATYDQAKKPAVVESHAPRLLPPGALPAQLPSPAKEEEPVVIQVMRPAEERAGIFLKDWMRRFSRM